MMIMKVDKKNIFYRILKNSNKNLDSSNACIFHQMSSITAKAFAAATNFFRWNKLLFILVTISFLPLLAIQNFNRSYFYRASGIWPEPRFEQSYLSTLTFSISGGETSCGSNCFGKKVPIVKLFRPCDSATATAKKKKWASWRYNGDFDLFELNFNAYQSVGPNVYLHLHLPAVHTQFSPGMIIEYPLKLNAKAYEKRSKIFCRSKCKLGLADTTLFCGFTKNSYNVCCLDFIDYTFQAGILFPTSKPCWMLKKYDIPLGYGGRWGGTFMLDTAAGIFNWLTFGIHADATLLAKGKDCFKFTDCNNSLGNGPIARIGGFLKADHICYGLSLAFAFSHENKFESNNLKLKNNNFDDFSIFCQQLNGWSRSIFHLIVEFDGGLFGDLILPEFAFSYHRQISGKNVFNTNILCGTFSFNACWFF